METEMGITLESDVAKILAASKEKTFSGAPAHLIVEKCVGCNNVVQHDGQSYCKSYKDPAAKWMFGQCNLGTHVLRKVEETKKVNPLKASKKAMKGK
jgi:hypothetical protein